MPNISGCSRCVSMPTSCAPTCDCISARTPLPSSVRRSSSDQRAAEHQRQREHQQLVAGELRAADLHRIGQVVVAAQFAAPHPGGEVLHQEHQAEGHHQAARLEDVEVGRGRRQATKAQPVHRQAQRHQHRERHRHHQQRRQAQRGLRHPGEVGADHQELAVRDVQDAHQPVLQVQAERHQRVDAAGDQAGGEQFEPGGGGHASVPGCRVQPGMTTDRQERSLTSRPACSD